MLLLLLVAIPSAIELLNKHDTQFMNLRMSIYNLYQQHLIELVLKESPIYPVIGKYSEKVDNI